ncbi:MFS transporter [Saccharopolyspora sp. NPDC050642]|uniref:MFS transporter n=1 Tax=Saccharopolyspora sp. NPDC050642 TaxID=3157099 RepID=UPI0033CC4807
MGKLLLVMALNAGGYYLLLGYLPTYLIEQVGLSQADSNLVVTISLITYLAIVPITASLSDRFGRKRTLIAACVLLIALSYPLMVLLSAGGMLLATVVLVLFLAMFSLNDAVFRPSSRRPSPRARGTSASPSPSTSAPSSSAVSPRTSRPG